MGTQGLFGYVIGRKKRLMHVQHDADLLWQILVREIYIIMKHYGSKEALKQSFEKIEVVKNNSNSKPKADQIEKCKFFSDFELLKDDKIDKWYGLLRYCQSSFINILEAGYILNDKNEYGFIFILDLNKGLVKYYYKDHEGKAKDLDTATLEEIMAFDEMPTKCYKEIVTEMQDKFNIYYENLKQLNDKLDKTNNIIKMAKQQGAANIEDKAETLLDDAKFELTVLNNSRRVFYNRLKALDLIDEPIEANKVIQTI